MNNVDFTISWKKKQTKCAKNANILNRIALSWNWFMLYKWTCSVNKNVDYIFRVVYRGANQTSLFLSIGNV